MEPYIRLESITYAVRGKTLLKDISITIHKDEVIALIGPNGAGKTTLSKVILGINKQDTGSVWLGGKKVETMQLFEVGRQIGYMFQNPSHQLFMTTVKEELNFALTYRGIPSEVVEMEVDQMMELFNIKSIANHLTYHLSQGEKQRVALATILLNKPQFLILDEPTKGLDEKHKVQMLQNLKVVQKQGIGMLLITHDQKAVEALASRLVTMRGGRIEADEPI